MRFIKNTAGNIEPNTFSPLIYNNVLLKFQKAGVLEVQANVAREAKGRTQDQVQHSTG